MWVRIRIEVTKRSKHAPTTFSMSVGLSVCLSLRLPSWLHVITRYRPNKLPWNMIFLSFTELCAHIPMLHQIGEQQRVSTRARASSRKSNKPTMAKTVSLVVLVTLNNKITCGAQLGTRDNYSSFPPGESPTSSAVIWRIPRDDVIIQRDRCHTHTNVTETRQVWLHWRHSLKSKVKFWRTPARIIKICVRFLTCCVVLCRCSSRGKSVRSTSVRSKWQGDQRGGSGNR